MIGILVLSIIAVEPFVSVAVGEAAPRRDAVPDGEPGRSTTRIENGTPATPPSERAIVIDGYADDWVGIPSLCSDVWYDTVYADDDIHDVYVTDDGTYLYLMMELANIGLTNIYFDLDVDQNMGTGYDSNTDIWDWYMNPHDTGIDYWIWVNVSYPTVTAELDMILADGTIIPIMAVPVAAEAVVEVCVLLSDIGEPAPPAINMDFQTYYYGPQDEAPDLGCVTYTGGPPIPSITVYTDKYSYGVGDTMYLGLDLANPGPPVTVCVAIWLEKPVGGNKIILHAHSVTLPDGLDYSNPSFKTFTLPSAPPGIYTWHAALLDPPTHDIVVEDTAEWELS
jgi:hypothetical protein